MEIECIYSRQKVDSSSYLYTLEYVAGQPGNRGSYQQSLIVGMFDRADLYTIKRTKTNPFFVQSELPAY